MDYLSLGIMAVTGAVSSAVFTRLLIPVLRKARTGQSIREEGPSSHLSKTGTPTMGGIGFIAAVTATCLATGVVSKGLLGILAVFIMFGLLGFLDDYLKVVKKHNLGLRAWQKLSFQIIMGMAIAIYQLSDSIYGTMVRIPVIEELWNFGLWYVPFNAFIIVAMVNSVNLTDGLDGLAAGVTSIVAVFFAVAGGIMGMSSGGGFGAALAGACFGFLIFNKYPAKIFMGDTGSLALGGGLAAMAIVMGMELFLPIVGFVYVAEALSVIIQVASFKTTGKRVFKMSPLHHHFELSGMSERQVVRMFWIATVLFCVIGLLML